MQPKIPARICPLPILLLIRVPTGANPWVSLYIIRVCELAGVIRKDSGIFCSNCSVLFFLIIIEFSTIAKFMSEIIFLILWRVEIPLLKFVDLFDLFQIIKKLATVCV